MALSQSEFAWYSDIVDSPNFTQGDIFLNFPAYEIGISDDPESNFIEVQLTEGSNVIVMTQACDLEQNKVSSVTFCPIIPLEMAIDSIVYEKQKAKMISIKQNENPSFTEQDLNDQDMTEIQKQIKSKGNRRPVLNNFFTGSYVNFYLLNESDDSPFQVVMLQKSFSLPIVSVKRIIEHFAINPSKRLNPPYREHLSQSFALAFSRIGLPIDIDRTEATKKILGE